MSDHNVLSGHRPLGFSREQYYHSSSLSVPYSFIPFCIRTRKHQNREEYALSHLVRYTHEVPQYRSTKVPQSDAAFSLTNFLVVYPESVSLFIFYLSCLFFHLWNRKGFPFHPAHRPFFLPGDNTDTLSRPVFRFIPLP